jgi:DNA-binding response OmpR family regulator
MSQPARPRVLVTEDDPDACDLIEFILSGNGFEVVCVSRAPEALAIARAESFDLYLLDNWMPEYSGIELCRQIRTFDTQTPILFYSGAAFETDKARAMECGAQGYLVKPSVPDALIAEARRLVQARERSESTERENC